MTSRDSFLTFVVAKPFGIDLGKLTLVVDVVKKGGQADRFGVKAGWRLLGVGDREVVIFDDLAEIVASLKNAGEKTCIVHFKTVNTAAVNKDASTFRESVFFGKPERGGLDVSTSDSAAAIEGTLFKRASNLTGAWQDRWFVAAGHYLKYYKNQAVAGRQDFCLCVIDLHMCEVSAAEDLAFRLEVEGGGEDKTSIVLRAATAAEAQWWVAQLRALKNGEGPAAMPEILNGAKDWAGGRQEGEEGEEEEEENEELASLRESFRHMEPKQRDLDLSAASSSLAAVAEDSSDMPPPVPQPSMLPVASTLSKGVPQEELQRQPVPAELKPKGSAVNEPSTSALKTMQHGQERRVSRRRSITARSCLAPITSTSDTTGTCGTRHFRDSPFCHAHAALDPGNAKTNAGGTSEFEDVIHKQIELALDHETSDNGKLSTVAGSSSELVELIGRQAYTALPENLQRQFSDHQECFQLHQQWAAILGLNARSPALSAAGANNCLDMMLTPQKLMAGVAQLGDDMDPKRVNMQWATTVVAELTGFQGPVQELPSDTGATFVHFVATVARMRRSAEADARSRRKQANKALGVKSDAAEDEDSDEDENEDDLWWCPILPPPAATVGTVLTVPLPGEVELHVAVPEGWEQGETFPIQVPPLACKAAMKAAVLDASGFQEEDEKASDGAAPDVAKEALGISQGEIMSLALNQGAASRRKQESREQIPGPATEYLTQKGRAQFALDAFLQVREVLSLQQDLPPLEGWMLKRGDALTIGYLNAWQVRYFRLEGSELCYYANKPAATLAEANIAVKRPGQAGALADAELRASTAGTALTEKERVEAFVQEQDDEEFQDKNLKGAINMSELVDIRLSAKTAVPVSAAKSLAKALGQDTSGEGGEMEEVVVFKVQTAKKRRYVLAVPYCQIVSVMVAFGKHVHCASVALRFRVDFGSGVPQKLTLAERMAWAASTYGNRSVIAAMTLIYQNEAFRKIFMDFPLYNFNGIDITPARIVAVFVVTKMAHDFYTAKRYADREKKYGVTWQYKKDVFSCVLCNTKFATVALRKEHAKHHCRMCGRVVCHACASTMLFYEVSGKRQRTCTFCIKNGGPPDSCRADASKARDVFSMVWAQKTARDVKKAEGKATHGARGKKGDALVVSQNKHKTTDLAQWTDWGIVPDAAFGVGLGGMLTSMIQSKVQGMISGPGAVQEFSVFVPPEALPGDSLEITLPDWSKGVGVVGSLGEQDRVSNPKVVKQAIQVQYSVDGVFMILPPEPFEPPPMNNMMMGGMMGGLAGMGGMMGGLGGM